MIEIYDTEKRLTELEIYTLENKLKIKIPKEYREHLLRYNGGRCNPNIFSFIENGNRTESNVDWFLAIYSGEYDNFEQYFNIYKVEEKRLPVSLIPIAHDSGGNLICIDVNDSKVYFWNHEKEVDYLIYDNRLNCHLVSESFSAFLSELS